MSRVLVGIILSTLLVSGAQARDRYPAPALTGERLYIAQIIDKESDRDDRLRPARLVRAIKIIDIDHDGVPDYLVDYRKAINTHWCGGDGGCSFELWRGVKHGHAVRVWNRIVRDYKIAQRGGETLFDFDFHGSNCGTFGASACPASFAWDSKAARLVERPTPDGQTIVHMIDPLLLTWAKVPANIAAAAQAASAKCKAYGHDDEAILPSSIPDIDGDGERDWAITTSVCDSPNQYDFQQILFASAGNASRPVIAASGAFFNVSIAKVPAMVARINKIDDCGGFNPDGKVCTQTPMIWNRATRKLDIKEH
jgi:hypothetical protein